MEDLLWVLLSLIFISLSAGLLGSFVLWQRLAYFSESLSHTALLGISLSIVFKSDYFYPIVLVSFILSFLFVKTKLLYSADSILSIFTNSFIALALIIFPFDHGLESILLGNLYALTFKKLYMILAVFCIIVVVMLMRWEEWLLVSANPEVACVAGIKVDRVRVEFLFLLSIFIAVSVDLVGFFFLGSLLIIPSAVAGLFAKTPFQMIILSVIVGIASSIMGVSCSWITDSPVGASIVLSASSFLLLSYIFTRSNLRPNF